MNGSAVWHPFTQHALEPPMKRIVSMEGAYLTDEDGNRFLDAISSWWVITHGHRHPAIMEAIRVATQAYDQIIFSEFSHEPAERLAEIEASLGLEQGWIERRTGIRARHWAGDGETLSGLAAEAGRMALEDARVARDEIALTLLATSTPDHLLPPSGPLLAHRLGLEKSGAIDLAGACSGFLYALTLADGFVRAQGRAVLVVAANILSRRINPAERASAVLFADAAGAVVLAPSRDRQRGLLSAELASDGSRYDLIHVPAGGSNRPFSHDIPAEDFLMTMRDGREVFSRAVELMTRTSQRVLDQAEIAIGQIDRFVPHQANARMFDAVCSDLGIDPTRTVRTIESFGNSSAATIPLSLSVAKNERPFAEGETLLLTAAGAGLTGGAIVTVI